MNISIKYTNITNMHRCDYHIGIGYKFKITLNDPSNYFLLYSEKNNDYFKEFTYMNKLSRLFGLIRNNHNNCDIEEEEYQSEQLKYLEKELLHIKIDDEEYEIYITTIENDEYKIRYKITFRKNIYSHINVFSLKLWLLIHNFNVYNFNDCELKHQQFDLYIDTKFLIESSFNIKETPKHDTVFRKLYKIYEENNIYLNTIIDELRKNFSFFNNFYILKNETNVELYYTTNDKRILSINDSTTQFLIYLQLLVLIFSRENKSLVCINSNFLRHLYVDNMGEKFLNMLDTNLLIKNKDLKIMFIVHKKSCEYFYHIFQNRSPNNIILID